MNEWNHYKYSKMYANILQCKLYNSYFRFENICWTGMSISITLCTKCFIKTDVWKIQIKILNIVLTISFKIKAACNHPETFITHRNFQAIVTSHFLLHFNILSCMHCLVTIISWLYSYRVHLILFYCHNK